MKKKVIALLLSATMVFSLAACGNGEQQAAETATDTAETDTAGDTETSEETDAAETSSGGDVLKIGLVAAITGTEPLEGGTDGSRT